MQPQTWHAHALQHGARAVEIDVIQVASAVLATSEPINCGTDPSPGEPILALSGLALHQAKKSGRLHIRRQRGAGRDGELQHAGKVTAVTVAGSV